MKPEILAAKEHASAELLLQKQLEVTMSRTPGSGYEMNVWGTFWKISVVDSLVQLKKSYRDGLGDMNEWFAVSASLAGLLRASLRLGEARETCVDMMKRVPEKAVVGMKEMAYIEARDGNLVQALEWGRRANEAAKSAFFRVAEDELRREYVNWQRSQHM